jgi:hypothetical protein
VQPKKLGFEASELPASARKSLDETRMTAFIDRHSGIILTPMVENVKAMAKENGVEDNYHKNTVANVALGREGTSEEVAKLIAFLLSDESTYISGNAISIDGGWNC